MMATAIHPGGKTTCCPSGEGARLIVAEASHKKQRCNGRLMTPEGPYTERVQSCRTTLRSDL